MATTLQEYDKCISSPTARSCLNRSGRAWRGDVTAGALRTCPVPNRASSRVREECWPNKKVTAPAPSISISPAWDFYDRQEHTVVVESKEKVTAAVYVLKGHYHHIIDTDEWDAAWFAREGLAAFLGQYRGF